MKKRKLNSKNPKYMDKSQLTTREVAKRELVCEAPARTLKGKLTKTKAKVSSVWFTN
tara:strand:- start:366 stop:536 length:171 start_codon:yes stop_codon:yes gene_type:complete